ncbi:hypothetical protein HCH15_08305 [Corynebacterium testudinoris]|uniref:Integral membrane protein n=1 Tax=Corynebacterium testudinoris TaxID=136857 RepID=A0A0G3H9W6_9CORY|nr:hypothetical protein [Corynebacterium testudinoris]AKK09575.1 hypothetical protein CTEST_10785 [Corynebacterium testudinoris]MBX8996181.1 hypothetical protein [Corynebacterium testudinoris]
MTQPYDPYSASEGENSGYAGYSENPQAFDTSNRTIDAVESFTQGSKALFSNFLPWVLSFLVYFAVSVGIVLVAIVPIIVSSDVTTDAYGNEQPQFTPLGVIALVVAYLLLFAVSFVWSLNMYRNGVRQVRGENVTFGDFFKLSGLAAPLGVYLLVSILTLLGMVLFIIPGLVVAFFLYFALSLVFIRPQDGVLGALRNSFQIVKANPGATFLIVLFTILLQGVGSLIVIGIIVALPMTMCIVAHAALKASGEPIPYRS